MKNMGWSLSVLIFFAIVIFVWLIKAPIMSSYISSKMEVPVSVRSISMWPTETTLRHFVIMNPSGYTSDAAFKVNRAKISYRFKQLTDTPSEIDEIALDGVYLNIELPTDSPKVNNWADIGAGMPEHGTGHEVIIHKLTLTNLTVETLGKGASKLGIAGTRHFDRMEFTEIDSREGFPTKELISRIFKGAGLQQFLNTIFDATGKIKDTLNRVNIFSQGEDKKKAPGFPGA